MPGVLFLNLKSDGGSQLANLAPQLPTACSRWCERYMMCASDDDWEELLLMDRNLCLKFTKSRRRWIHQLWESRTEGQYFKLCNISNFLISSDSTAEWTYQLRFEISVVIISVSFVPNRRHISHKFFQMSFVHWTPNHVLIAAGVRPDWLLDTNLICFEPTVGSCWEKTRQSHRVQCNHCRKQYSSPFLLPYLESVQTVVSVLAPLQPRP
jgi:hypothetical protein